MYDKRFDGLSRDALERVAAHALDARIEAIARCSAILERAREARAALRGILGAVTPEETIVAIHEAARVIEQSL